MGDNIQTIIEYWWFNEMTMLMLGLWRLTPLSTIFQLYGDSFIDE